MCRFAISPLLIVVLISGCVTTTQPDSHDELAVAKSAIAQARASRAEACAPQLLAKAESRLLWAAHELEEHKRGAQSSTDELADLIAQAERYAREAKDVAIDRCREATTVILLPDEDGKVGAISLNAAGGSQIIHQAFHSSSVRGESSQPEAVQALDESVVNRQFASLLKAQPLKPAHFTLYFISGSSTLTPASRALIPEVLKATKQRHPAEVNIVGHTDSTGSEHVNMRISSERAKAVEQILKAADLVPESIYLRFYGENDPLVPTANNVAEPRNRRVEVMVL